MASRPKSGASQSRRRAPRGRKPTTIDLEAKDVGSTGSAEKDVSKTAAAKSAPASSSAKTTGSSVPNTSSAKSDSVNQSEKSASAARTSSDKKGADQASEKASPKPSNEGPVAGKPSNPANMQPDTISAKSSRSGGGFFSALLGGAVAIAGLVGLGQFENARNIPMIGVLFGGNAENGQAVDAADIKSLRDEIAGLSSGRVDLTPTTERISALENQLLEIAENPSDDSAILDRLSSLEGDLNAVRAETPSTEGADSLQVALDEIASRVQALETTAANNDAAGSLDAYDAKLAAIEDSVSALRKEIASNSEGLQTLASQSGELQDTVASVKASEKVARSVAANALGTALENDDPLSLPISSLEALIGQTPETQRLGELDAQGIPSLKSLASGLDVFADSVGSSAAPSADASLSDRFWANAQKLVSFRSTGPREGDDPLAVLSRVKAHVRNGALSDAKTEWAKLPADLQGKGANWIEQLDLRLEAQAIYKSISQQLASAAG